jgi:hypothetical protein
MIKKAANERSTLVFMAIGFVGKPNQNHRHDLYIIDFEPLTL